MITDILSLIIENTESSGYEIKVIILCEKYYYELLSIDKKRVQIDLVDELNFRYKGYVVLKSNLDNLIGITLKN